MNNKLPTYITHLDTECVPDNHGWWYLSVAKVGVGSDSKLRQLLAFGPEAHETSSIFQDLDVSKLFDNERSIAKLFISKLNPTFKDS